MLLLRRFPNQRIAIFDNRGEIWLTVAEIDADEEAVSLEIGNSDGEMISRKVLGMREKFRPRQWEDVEIMLERITFMEPPPDECTIGITAPRSVIVKNEELLRGTSRKYRERMRR